MQKMLFCAVLVYSITIAVLNGKLRTSPAILEMMFEDMNDFQQLFVNVVYLQGDFTDLSVFVFVNGKRSSYTDTSSPWAFRRYSPHRKGSRQ